MVRLLLGKTCHGHIAVPDRLDFENTSSGCSCVEFLENGFEQFKHLLWLPRRGPFGKTSQISKINCAFWMFGSQWSAAGSLLGHVPAQERLPSIVSLVRRPFHPLQLAILICCRLFGGTLSAQTLSHTLSLKGGGRRIHLFDPAESWACIHSQP